MDKVRRDKQKEVHARLDFGESYDNSHSSYGTRITHGYRYRDRDRSRHTKRGRDSESPLSSVSKSDSSNGGNWKLKSKRHKPKDEDDLKMPWMCEEVDPFTPRIRNFKSSRKTRMPNNVKTYGGTRDPKDHVKIFQAAARVERLGMPTWCHMFNSTLIGAARVWSNELPPESIDGYKDLKAAFLAYFMQQKKYVKDPVEIHNIKQKDGETIEDFMEQFKVETERMKGALECMRIPRFMHGVNNPKLTKRLNEHVPKTMEEMMITTTTFIREEAVAASKEKGKLSHLIKEIKQGRDQSKVGKKEAPAKDKPTIIYMIQLWQRMTRQKVTQSFKRVREITFPSLATSSGTEGPLVIEAEIGEHMIHRMNVDGGSSTKLNIGSISGRDIHPFDKSKWARPRNAQRPSKQRPLQADYVIKEIHEGSCNMHAGPRSVVAKALRLGYYWPTMHRDARDMIRTCNDCQIHRPVTRSPQKPLTPITALWPFYKWGIDIAGPFPEGPREIVSNNNKQFSDNPFKDWCDKLNITRRFASVKHPQSNGLVERANQSLREGIKALLEEGNKNWVEELFHVLWAHCTMIKSSHGDTPFSLTYGTKAVIPAEIRMPTYRTAAVDVVNKDEELRINLDLSCCGWREARSEVGRTLQGNESIGRWSIQTKIYGLNGPPEDIERRQSKKVLPL
nr:reverse transcriptase domain-containing protein [Tanacetum cinerariifolium]